MARLRKPTVPPPAATVPPELADHLQPCWQSEPAFHGWLNAHKLTVDRHHPDCIGRRDAATMAWIIANGYTNPDHPRLPDHHRLRELELTPTTRASIRLRHHAECPHCG